MKKGVLVLSDMVWFLLFIIAAAFIFYGLYRPLMEDIKDDVQKNTIDGEGRGLQSDAAFIATTLPRMKVDKGTFSDAIRALLRARGDTGLTSENVHEYAPYVQFLDSTMRAELWRYTQDHPRRLQALAVVLRDQTNYYTDTCIEYSSAGRKKSGERLLICNRIVSSSPLVSGMDSLGVTRDEHIERGLSYIPTEQGIVVLEVLMYYEENT